MPDPLAPPGPASPHSPSLDSPTDRPHLRRIAFGGPTSGPDALHLPDVLRSETVGGFLMVAATVVALVWANVSHESYVAVSHAHLGPMTLAHWASDGLLTVFFFVAGLELKRELVEGSLSRPADALVPIIAAVCGMAVPAGIYVAINSFGASGSLQGWAIPMATDIAFALAVLAIVGRNLPSPLRAFLLTLAIVDDLGAIIVIAVVYTSSISVLWLLGAAAAMALWWAGHHWRIKVLPAYLVLFVAAWWCMYQSGIHATIAGVALGLLTSIRKDELHDPADRWQHAVQPWSAGLCVPLFAVFAAGVPISASSLSALWSDPVPLGIIVGLVLGKIVGVFGGAWLATRLTAAELSPEVGWIDLASVSALAGIGFTVSMLISELSFATDLTRLDEAKTAVLTASLIAALVGGILVTLRSRVHGRRQGLAASGS
ncbi:Na(+)/H(+) antiporter NhaA [Aestuariimicrobium sp. T2.26MG-19.2B]|uniref:Na+/H+ antiporter NhaA n=1 Tax=Aestuariimicrobium sp. T2.26MG-19.2B TaxID=3040679 RepID=UPI002477B0F5|nr:Na+/H+ antiporter NhaA [Aestuariimicrobium sp. T2.26MG-19.2B]CAI9404740.1 Na(+)/H(+) antiporter NhaA [Aestuariimicrobium sp. T2.26MG-19.2B]